jgi:hypothetical protein
MPPKQRPARKPPSAPDSRRTLLWVGIAAGVVLVAGGLSLYLRGGDAEPRADARAALEAAGCTLSVSKAPDNSSDHSDVPSPDFVSPAWTSDPPTSGPHYGETAIYGAYDAPLQQARLVHNLEHGAVYVQYGRDVPDATVAELRAFYESNRYGTLLAPYPPLGGRIALGAWVDEGSGRGDGFQALCTTFDQDAYQAFLAAYQFRGPERFAPTAMAPGRG